MATEEGAGVERVRGVVRDCVSKHLYSSAIFFADKVAGATSDPADVYMLAQALFLGRQFRRALHVLVSSNLIPRDLRFRYLAAKCLEELKEWHQCLTMLGDAKVDENGVASAESDSSIMCLDKDSEDHEINISSAICFLRGKTYEALENHTQARIWYIAAVKADPLCYEALECLLENHLLTCEEEKDLLPSLKFKPEDGWISAFYSCLIKKHDKQDIVEEQLTSIAKDVESHSQGPSFSRALKNNTDLMVCKAEYYQQSGEYQKCFDLTSSLLEKDPFHLKCMVVHLVAAMELGRSNELYLLGSNLVKDYPQKALSWFAVGCYCYCIQKFDQSRRYFGKATTLEAAFPPAWIGCGNAYSVQDENDQAMAVYRSAARLFPGLHLPNLYIGMEYMRTHQYKLAEQFFMQAKSICPSDPLVYNELGVVAYHSKQYKISVSWFRNTLSLLDSNLTEIWEPTFINLAHALRKLKLYKEAIMYYEKALILSTRSVSTYAGLAYTHHLQGNFGAAIALYHKALWLKPDDQFCTEMLRTVLEDEYRRGIDYMDESML